MSAIITEDINLCATVLRDGGVVICPTEGVYGLSCAVFSDDAVKRIISIKNRDSAKGLIIVSDSEKRLDNILDKELLSVDDKALYQNTGQVRTPLLSSVKTTLKALP